MAPPPSVPIAGGGSRRFVKTTTTIEEEWHESPEPPPPSAAYAAATSYSPHSIPAPQHHFPPQHHAQQPWTAPPVAQHGAQQQQYATPWGYYWQKPPQAQQAQSMYSTPQPTTWQPQRASIPSSNWLQQAGMQGQQYGNPAQQQQYNAPAQPLLPQYVARPSQQHNAPLHPPRQPYNAWGQLRLQQPPQQHGAPIQPTFYQCAASWQSPSGQHGLSQQLDGLPPYQVLPPQEAPVAQLPPPPIQTAHFPSPAPAPRHAAQVLHMSPRFPHTVAADKEYLKSAITGFTRILGHKAVRDTNKRLEHTTKVLLEMLKKCDVARPENTQANFGNGKYVADLLKDSTVFKVPIFFHDERVQEEVGGIELVPLLQGELQKRGDIAVAVQDSSLNASDHSAFESSLRTVIKRLEKGAKGRDRFPWNMLEFRLDHAFPIARWFLQGHPFGFLDIIRARWHGNPLAQDTLANDNIRWVTFGECTAFAGASTTPHIDTAGMDTVLTCVQGRLGLIYPESPSPEDLQAYYEAPGTIPPNMHYRLKVVRQGQGVFLPAGTIHAVVRLPGDEHTLTFGSHLLPSLQIHRFAELCEKQIQCPDIANEDVYETAVPYLIEVGKMVAQDRAMNPECTTYGGLDVMTTFWECFGRALPGLQEDNVQAACTFQYRHPKDPRPVPDMAGKNRQSWSHDQAKPSKRRRKN